MRNVIAVFKFGIMNCRRIRDQMRGLNTARAQGPTHLSPYKLFTKHWYSRILIIVRLCGIIAAKYCKINCKNFKIVQLGLSLEPATMLDLLMCSTPLGGRHLMQDDREINRY